MACAALALGSGSGRASAVTDPGCGTSPIVQRSGTVIYALPRTFLRAGSDSVWSGARPLARGADYVLDRTRGLLRLLIEPVPGETLWVRACGLIAPPPLEFRGLTYRPAAATADRTAADSLAAPPAARPATLRSPNEAPPGAALSLTGNKTIAVEFGSSQDAFLRQSLDLAVSGSLAPGVELTGVLSDRNTPLTTAGSTRDLQSLDRLLLELRAPQGGAALGDVALSLDRGEFGRLERRLQGARGEWTLGGVEGVAAAASAEGEFQSLQFYGIEGRQGPYTLTSRDGTPGISVVPGSEVVMLEGQRLTRGESADYAIDYERATLTFSNRRPISSASRVTVDYQVAVNRYRRNFAAAAARTARGPWSGSFAFMTEGDDRGRPLAGSFDDSDRLVLAAAGDSAGSALGSGVGAGPGDYDLVGGGGGTFYAFAGPDSGSYAVSFARVRQGQGDYADSVAVAGRVAYRYVGVGNGAYRIGRPLPLPDAHQLWDLGAAARLGALALELEGALSRRDRNTFSALDDGDDLGGAGSARLALEGASPRWLGGRAGVSLQWRTVERRFEPFTRLERPFVQEDWGLPAGTDLEHQRRAEASAFVRPGPGGELRLGVGRLETASGFASLRGAVGWDHAGRIVTRARWERAEGEQDGRAFPEGGRERRSGELGVKLSWLEPLVRADWDERWTPSDTGRAGERYREVGVELGSGSAVPWRLLMGYSVRRNARLGAGGWSARNDARTARLSLRTPEERPWAATLAWQRRTLAPLADPDRTASDLASARVGGTDVRHGLSALLGLEVTSEGESERARQLQFVGSAQGAYDSLGGFVGAGRGDYNLLVLLTGQLRRISRAAASARLAWQPPGEGTWQGSRAEVAVETDARRRGELEAADTWLSAGAALADPGLSRGAITQRIEADFAPNARFTAVTLRAERRVSADRSFSNFVQTQDERSGTARWRARPARGWTTELEGRLKRGAVAQSAGLGPGFARVVRETGMLGQLGYAPHARLRAALVSDLGWSRDAAGGPPWSRTWRVGPDLGVSVFGPGRLELSARRTLTRGTPVGALLLGDPLGTLRWEATARFDYRLRDQTTVGVSFTSRDRDRHAPEHDGRAEVRAFF